jgi:predicted lipoprotein with Yx(FWY)xxD motif
MAIVCKPFRPRDSLKRRILRRPHIENVVDYKAWLGPLAVAILILEAGYAVAYPLSSSTQTGALATFSTGQQYTVSLAYKAGIGFYLVNASGFTLYFRATDPGNGSSTCTGGCVGFWPLFNAGSGTIKLPPLLSSTSFGTATRSDGLKQTTFDGYPLYYYVKDTAPGETNGQGKGNFYVCCSILNSSTTSTTSSAP